MKEIFKFKDWYITTNFQWSFCCFLGDFNKTCATIAYLLDRKFNKVDVLGKKSFAYKLLKDDRSQVNEIFERSSKFDKPILDIVSYALEEIHLNEDLLEIVNNALTESELKGLILRKEDLYISLWDDQGNYSILK